jgi:hypothetical protein
MMINSVVNAIISNENNKKVDEIIARIKKIMNNKGFATIEIHIEDGNIVYAKQSQRFVFRNKNVFINDTEGT